MFILITNFTLVCFYISVFAQHTCRNYFVLLKDILFFLCIVLKSCLTIMCKQVILTVPHMAKPIQGAMDKMSQGDIKKSVYKLSYTSHTA